MTKTSVKKKIHFARDFDERTLSQFESTIRAIDPANFSITVNFRNGFSVTCASVTELMNVPLTDADPVEKLQMRCEEDFATARAAGRPQTQARLWIDNEFFFSIISYEIEGDYSTCVSLQHQLDATFRTTRAVLRSILHVQFFVDLLIPFIVLPALMALLVFPRLGIPSDNFGLLQLAVAALYGVSKFIIFPRVQLNWGYGAKASRRRSGLVKWLSGFVVVGAFSTIYQDVILEWWKGNP